MSQSGRIKHVFPASNTPSGFHSYFSYMLPQEQAKKIYCIKGGPGTGKSSFMKKIGNYASEHGLDAEFHHCSSDPNSLDGVVIPSLGIAILDGTAPHIVDPITPGAIDCVLNFGDFWDERILQENREAITECRLSYSSYFPKAYFYLNAAKQMYDSYIFTESKSIDESLKLETEKAIFQDIWHKVKPLKGVGKTRHLFGTSIGCDGVLDYLHTIIGTSKNIYFIKETLGCNSKALMNRIVDHALLNGFNIECYHSPIDVDKIEDIVIPDLDLSITVNHPFHKPKIIPTHIYDLTTCIKKDTLASSQIELDRDKNLLNTLLDKGIAYIAQAKKIHDTLETYYISAVNFSKIDRLCEQMIQDIFNPNA
ncbi:MAG: hypothetical protein ACRCTE_04290 [Cellulosilyticaceae bacterium]